MKHTLHTTVTQLIILQLTVATMVSPLATRQTRADFLAASALTDSVVRFSDDGANLGDFIKPGSGGLNSPFVMEYGPDGQTLYVGGGGGIWVYDRFSGAPIGRLPLPADMWDGLSFAPNGDLFASNLSNRTVYRINSGTGEVLASIASPNLFAPNHLLQLPDGRLLVADASIGQQGAIQVIDTQRNVISGTFASLGFASAPMGMVIGPDGLLYVADSGRKTGIYRFDTSTGQNLGVFNETVGGYLSDIVFPAENTMWADQLLSGSLNRFDATTGQFLGSVSSPPDSWDLLHMPEPASAAVVVICGGLLLSRRRGI